MAFLTAGLALFERYGVAVDLWLTSAGYFMSRRELAGMRRMVDDDSASLCNHHVHERLHLVMSHGGSPAGCPPYPEKEPDLDAGRLDALFILGGLGVDRDSVRATKGYERRRGGTLALGHASDKSTRFQRIWEIVYQGGLLIVTTLVVVTAVGLIAGEEGWPTDLLALGGGLGAGAMCGYLLTMLVAPLFAAQRMVALEADDPASNLHAGLRWAAGPIPKWVALSGPPRGLASAATSFVWHRHFPVLARVSFIVLLFGIPLVHVVEVWKMTLRDEEQPRSFRELVASGRRHVLIAGSRFDHGRELLEPLHTNMKEHGVAAQFFLYVPSARPDVPEGEHTRKFIDEFLIENWPRGTPRPEFFYDPRTPQSGSRASLHAKCVVVDERLTLVGSASFTDRGQSRNIEGVLIEGTEFAEEVSSHWQGLIRSQLARSA